MARAEMLTSVFSNQAARRSATLGFSLDHAQLAAATHFDRLESQLLAQQGGNWLVRWFAPVESIRGIYLWGGVGRGKTFLMDLFYESLRIENKKRVHFHRLMQSVHQALARVQGKVEPVAQVAREMAAEARVLCLDEFHVTDIGDAMLMKSLLEGLSESGVTLVTTANQPPDELYRHGLQRARFLPAIECIKRRMEVVNLDGGTDYRLRMLEQGGVFHYPLTDSGERKLDELFSRIADGPGDARVTLEIDGRLVRSRKVAKGIVWFDAAELLLGPRGTADYIELAKRYHTVVIANLLPFSMDDQDRRRRFSWLIDEFYDRRVKLILSAATTVPELFGAAGDSSEVQRTESRLIEMQSHSYLAEAHLP